MSTPNFSYDNVLLAKGDLQDEYEYDDDILNIRSALDDFDEIEEWNDDRSYPRQYIAQKIISDGYYNTTRIKISIGSGYYGGMNVDYHIITTDGRELTKTEQKKIASFSRRFVKEMTGIGYKRLNHVATFSNGEAVYELAKTN